MNFKLCDTCGTVEAHIAHLNAIGAHNAANAYAADYAAHLDALKAAA